MKTNPRLVQLRDEFNANKLGLEYLDALVAEAGRDFTAEENVLRDGAIGRMEAIETEVTASLNRAKHFDATADVLATIGVGDDGNGRTVVGSPARTRGRSAITYDPTLAGTPYRRSVSTEEIGHFAHELGRTRLKAVLGKITSEDAAEVFNRWDVNPANELGRVVAGDPTDEMGRVLAHGVSGDGTAPVTIEGDLIKFVDANRYAVNAARILPMPDNHAPTFKRPRTTQRTTSAKQANEGDVLSSQRMQNTGDTVTKETHGGVLSFSEQEIDWTDPAMLGLAIEDLAESYAIDTNTVLTAAITAAGVTAGSTTALALAPTAAAFVAAVAASAAKVFSSSKKMADVLFSDVSEWANLVAITDTTGRPLFPIAGPYNEAGSNTDGVATFTGFTVLGLRLVVDPNFATNTLITARSSLVEFYEQNKGLLSINVPSTLEVQYAYRGYVAANVYSQGVNAFALS